MNQRDTHIDLPNYIIANQDRIDRLIFKEVQLGSWETPLDERTKGFSLRAVYKDEQPASEGVHVATFGMDECSEEQAFDLSDALAKELGVTLVIKDQLSFMHQQDESDDLLDLTNSSDPLASLKL